MNEISYSYERMGTKTRFEKEAKSNSEIAYSLTTQWQPCERRQAALRVPSETMEDIRVHFIHKSTTVDLVVLANQDSQGY